MTTIELELQVLVERFQGATCPEDVFGPLAGAAPDQLATLKLKGRLWMKSCHPDLAPAGDKPLATKVFQLLANWESGARQKIETGTYGDYQPAQVAPFAPSATPLRVNGKTLLLTGILAEGTFATIHDAEFEDESDDDAGMRVFVKVARDAADNDLLEREFGTLRALQTPDPRPEVEEFLCRQRVYVPTPRATFFLRDESGLKHRANVLCVPQGECYTAETLLRDKFAGGIEPRHVWWIFRRLLLTLWMAHGRGFVHGAITPDHLLIFPAAHGIVLLDWTCAARIGQEHVPALCPAYADHYAPETARKELAAPSADIFMAAATALIILGGDVAKRRVPDTVPTPLADCLLRCLEPSARRRPQDAQQLHEEFGLLLGKRVFSPMTIP